MGAELQQGGQQIAQTETPAPRGMVLFEDDFSTYSNRWNENESPKSSVAYRDGGLVLRVVSPGVTVWSVPDFALPLDTYTLQATATFLEGSADSAFGCVLAYTDEESFYAFLISLDGEWQFLHYDEGVWVDLTPEEYKRVDTDTAESEGVLLRVNAVGGTFDFWVGAQHMGTVTVADDWQGSGFGVIAHAGHGHIEVLFETVVVSELAGDMERGTTN